MAVGREILTQIRSVKNTQKITKAMQMVSTSKMRKTQDRMKQARPYAKKIRAVMGNLATSSHDEKLPILEVRPNPHRSTIVLVTTDKGLCGGLNANVIKRFFLKVQEYKDMGIDVDVACIGSKGLAACQRVGIPVITSVVNLGDVPKMEILLGSLKMVFDRYAAGETDSVYLMYTEFVNTMKQEISAEYLLPIGADVLEKASESKYGWDYVYEPDPITVLEFLVRRYFESVVYQAMCDNMASEQAARMVAMRSATDNATNAIKELQLVYNKSRQAAITTELSEIVAGAAAV